MSIISDVKEYLEQYDKVVWMENECIIPGDWMKDPMNMVLYTGDKEIIENAECTFRKLNPVEEEELRKLYYLYDFSNKFIVLSDSERYGSLLNYVKTGVMTMDEVQKAIT